MADTAVIGLGKSGLSTVKYLLSQGIIPDVYDTREHPAGEEQLPDNIKLIKGALDGKKLAGYRQLVTGPGMALSLPALKQAADGGAHIIGDIELFALKAHAPVIGVTGSNGKSTVVTLVHLMAVQDGQNCGLGGNIGIPALDVLGDDKDSYVLELSSFELETTYSLKLRGAVILNLSEDHLDRYAGSMQLYLQAKQRIFTHAENIVINREDKATIPPSGHYYASFGGDNESYGRINDADGYWLAVNGQKVMPVSKMIIQGRHNQMNALAAMALADTIGVSRSAQIKVLSTFKGLPHRCCFVRELDGVRYFNDSKATNVASTEAAVMSLGEDLKGKILLLAGGLGKGQDFSPLARFLGHEVGHIFCFGRDGGQIADLGKETSVLSDMGEALKAARRMAKPGDIVLLSPACASFDQFKGFEHRGDVFTEMAGKLA